MLVLLVVGCLASCIPNECLRPAWLKTDASNYNRIFLWHCAMIERLLSCWIFIVRTLVWDVCPNFLQPFLENTNRRNCNNGSRETVPVLHNPHWKGWPSPLAVEWLVVVLSKAASSGREKKQVWMHTQKTREYLERSYQVGWLLVSRVNTLDQRRWKLVPQIIF